MDPPLRITAVGTDIDALAEFAVAGGGIVWAGSFIARHYVQEGQRVPLWLKPARQGQKEQAGQLQFEMRRPLQSLRAQYALRYAT